MGSKAWVVLAVALAGCGGIKEAEQRERNIGDQTADITSDTRVLGDASAADCTRWVSRATFDA